MANLPIELVKFNGEVGPQYLDREDKSGGPEGTMKPLTKEMLRDLAVQNFPELQKVSDEDVLARLNSLESKIDSIIENGAVNTQLIGSNVEQTTYLKETISGTQTGSIPAGQTITVVEIENPCELESLAVGTSYRGLFLRVENRIENGNYETGMRLLDPRGRFSNPISPVTLKNLGGENDFWREFVYDDDEETYAFGMKRNAKFGSGLRIRITNNNDVDHTMGVSYLITKHNKVGD